jgi:nitrogenase molybdenum-iron protein alpha/beta subunit
MGEISDGYRAGEVERLGEVQLTPKTSKPVAAEYTAEVRQVKSMVDHSYNVTINFSEDMLPVVQRLMECIGMEVKGTVIFPDST